MIDYVLRVTLYIWRLPCASKGCKIKMPDFQKMSKQEGHDKCTSKATELLGKRRRKVAEEHKLTNNGSSLNLTEINK